MRNPTRQKNNQSGFIVTVELLFIVTILVIGLVVGWIQVRNSVIAELVDTSEAVGAMNQTYTFPGTQDIPASAFTAGSEFIDDQDLGQGFADDYATSLGNAGNGGTTEVNLPAAGLE